jgi:hypothetical protein
MRILIGALAHEQAVRMNVLDGLNVLTGESYQSDEQCVAVGYFFPATRPLWCWDGFGPY